MKISLKNLFAAFVCAVLFACAHGKMGVVDQALEKGSIPTDRPILVSSVGTGNLQVSGDKAADQAKVDDEKIQIETRFHRMIADQLKLKGFKSEAVTGQPKKGLLLSGKVTRFEHGSAAARILVGMGAGSSNLYTDFVLKDLDTGKTISKFEVIATSGGNGGLQAAGGYINAHLTDGAEKAAEYIAEANAGKK